MKDLFLVCLLCASLVHIVCAGSKPAIPAAPDLTSKPVDVHHSLHTDMDKNLLFWRFGGSTVISKHKVRLTPAAQSRKGWFWNDYPLRNAQWELEIKMKAESANHFGGDGFAIWIVSSDINPAHFEDLNHISGDLFGMRSDFFGYGICFDTYDNDNMRDNPSIFMVENLQKKHFHYNHDDDFKRDMMNKPVHNLPIKCTADYRNTMEPFRVLIRTSPKLDKIYIYVDVGSGNPKFCLAQSMTLDPEKDWHLAYTAMTGQLADSMDISEIALYYTEASEAELETDDIELSASWSTDDNRFLFWFWVFILLLQIVLLLFIGLEIYYSILRKDHFDTMVVCKTLNDVAIPHLLLHTALFIVFLFGGSWFVCLINLPLVIARIYALSTSTYVVEPSQLFGKNSRHEVVLMKISTKFAAKQYAILALYVVTLIWLFIRVEAI